MKDNPVVYVVQEWLGGDLDGRWYITEVFIQKSDAEKYVNTCGYEAEILEIQTK